MSIVDKLTDEQVRNLLPGVTLTEGTVIREWRVFELLRAAVEADVFHPLLVMAWEAKGDDGIPSVALTINMGGGVQLCGPIWVASYYTQTDARGVAAARHVLRQAERAINCVVNSYRERGGRA